MKILVTGGLGFIGSNFIRYTLPKHPQKEIVNIDKIGLGANLENLKDLKNEDRYHFIKADISNLQALNGIIGDCDVVINFAAETHVDRSIADPKPFLESNTIGTFNLLEAERKMDRKIRHIQISTDEVYGDITKGSFTETDNLRPSSPYAATKAAADLLCNAYARTYGMNIIVTRCTNNFGPYQFPEKLIPKTILRAINNLKIPVYGTGEAIRDWLYVLDHCSAIELIMNKGKRGEVYNISGGYEISVTQIVMQILNLLDKTEDLITFVKDRPGHDMRYSLDSTKLRTSLGWKPEHEFDKALAETVDWYSKNEWWWKPIINEKVLHPTPWES